jgi:anti-sigma factor RsiW
MMSCHESNGLIEAVAVGDDVPDAVRAHVATCPQCAARLRLAQRIEQALSSRPVVAAPQGFATTVLARVRRERWRSEQLLDWSFNAFVGIGVVLVVLGVFGLVYASGLVVISRDVFAALDIVAQNAGRIAADEAPTVALGMLLLTLTLGVWWWVEQEDAPI